MFIYYDHSGGSNLTFL